MKNVYFFILVASCALMMNTISSCSESAAKNEKTQPKDLDSLISMFPDSVPLLVQRGNKYLKAFNFEKALADGAHAFRLDSNNLEARLLYAQGLNNKLGRTLEDVTVAQRHYKTYLNKDPKSPEALVGLAATYGFMQDFDNAFENVNQALKIDPRFRDAYILKGSLFLVLGKTDLAKSSYETAVQQDPNFFEAYMRLGALYLEENNNIALEYYTTAHRLRPHDAEALYCLAYTKETFNDIPGATAAYREMAQIDSSNYYVARGLFHLGSIKDVYENQLDSAIYYYKSAIETEPRYVEAYHNLGVCYEEKGDVNMALKQFSKALKYNPDYELSRKAADKYK